MAKRRVLLYYEIDFESASLPKKIYAKKVIRACLKCDKDFESLSKYNRICKKCKRDNELDESFEGVKDLF